MFVRMRRVPSRSRCKVCIDIDTDIVGVTINCGTLSVAFVLSEMISGTGLGRLFCAWAVVQPIQLPRTDKSTMRWTLNVLDV